TDGGLRNLAGNGRRRVRQLRANGKQIALDVLKEIAEVVAEILFRPGDADHGVELIDLAVGSHARVGLPHTRPSEQTRVSSIARARVNFHAAQYTAASIHGW